MISRAFAFAHNHNGTISVYIFILLAHPRVPNRIGSEYFDVNVSINFLQIEEFNFCTNLQFQNFGTIKVP